MTFSRFIHHLLLFFLLNLLAILAKPIGFAGTPLNHRPLFFEIPRIPEALHCSFTSIIAEKNNRLVIATEHDVFIYEGKYYQQIKVKGTPHIAYDGDKRVAITAGNQLSILTFKSDGGYNITPLIVSNENLCKITFTGVGFGRNNNIYLSTGKKLWLFNETLNPIDSSEHNISIYTTPKGLIFHTTQKGFFNEVGEKYPTIYNITKTFDPEEKILRISFAGTYIFVTTSAKRLLMYNKQGMLISEVSDFINSLPNIPIDICTSDDITFFAITSNQIYRFINPNMLEVFGLNNNLRGIINYSIVIDGEQYVATSYALYKSIIKKDDEPFFSIIGYGNFTKLSTSDNKLFALSQDGLYFVSTNRMNKITPENNHLYNVSFIQTNDGVQYLIEKDTITAVEKRIIDTSQNLLKNIGKTFSNQTIFSFYNTSNPNLTSFIINNSSIKASTKSFFAIENNIKINNLFLDSDSTLWLSSNNGLIKVSKKYLQTIRNQKPILNFSLIAINQKDSITVESNNSIKVRQGESLLFKLACLGPNAWQSPTFSYKINDEKSSWTEWTPNPTVSFNNLKPKIYTIAFKTKDVLGTESNEALIKVKVIPSFIQTKFTIVAFVILILIVAYVINRWRFFFFALERYKLESIINRRTEELVKEKEKTDNLLARVLPRETASELKETGKVNTQKFNLTTVLFSDIQGFTKITDELNPENLIDQLDTFFTSTRLLINIGLKRLKPLVMLICAREEFHIKIGRTP